MQYEENRWLQRFQNYQRALYHLDAAVEKGVDNMNQLEIQGFIKGFELVMELAWKTLQDYLQEQGYDDLRGPKPVIQQSFKDGLIEDGNEWVEMLESRNKAAHTYDEELALELANKIADSYYANFDALDVKLTGIKNAL